MDLERETRAFAVDGLVQEDLEIIGGHGASEVVALARVASQGRDLLVLLGGLDAFGDDGHAQVVGQVDDGADDGLAARSLAEVGDEARSIFTMSTGNRLR